MKRKIKDFITKILEYCKSHKNMVYNIIIIASMIIAAIILGITGFNYHKPEKVTNAEIEYSKGMVKELVNSNFKDSLKIIKKMEEKGYKVDLNYEDSEVIINFTGIKGEIIFSNLSDDDISYEVSYSEAKENQLGNTIVIAFLGIIVGPIGLLVILVIMICILYIIEGVQKLKKKLKHR